MTSSETESVDDTIKYEDRLLAFVDVLGWSELIRRSVADQSAMAIVYGGTHALRIVHGVAQQTDANARASAMPEAPQVQASIFSDTVVLSTACNDAGGSILAAHLETLCSCLLQVTGCYTRGAVVRGLLRHSDGVIYGPALLDAYKIESTVAKYPRIVVAPEAAPYLRIRPPRVDFDGLLYFDTLRPIQDTKEEIQKLELVCELVRRYISQSAGDLERLAKHQWLLRYAEETLIDARKRTAQQGAAADDRPQS